MRELKSSAGFTADKIRDGRLVDETSLGFACAAIEALLREIQGNVRIRGDGELLTQMFSNLIENAIRHTPAGTRILIRLAVSGDTVAASVEDNGPGIPLGEYDKVFRRFYRLTSSRSTPGYGG